MACVPPAAIGSASANLYAIIAAALLPVLGVLQGSLLAWVIAVATITLRCPKDAVTVNTLKAAPPKGLAPAVSTGKIFPAQVLQLPATRALRFDLSL